MRNINNGLNGYYFQGVQQSLLHQPSKNGFLQLGIFNNGLNGLNGLDGCVILTTD